LTWEIIEGDCIDVMRGMASDSVDSIVTDPPYGLRFMGKAWDRNVPSVEVWREALRVLKPGGHLLAFAGTRTQHRMAVNIEDAGFEIRDMIGWLYGSGFPKSLDVGKAIDKAAAIFKVDNSAFADVRDWLRAQVKAKGLTYKTIDTALGNPNSHKASHYLDNSQPQLPTPKDWDILKRLLGIDIDPARPSRFVRCQLFEREILGHRKVNAGVAFTSDGPTELPITAPATEAARQWDGFGTALKPAFEPITLARKPIAGTVAANVLKHGTGGINVDGCRVGTGDESRGRNGEPSRDERYTDKGSTNFAAKPGVRGGSPSGRFPANIIHDGSDEVLAVFPETASGNLSPLHNLKASENRAMSGANQARSPRANFGGDSGSAARFFYCAKTSKAERSEENHHPTVKPVDLMRYLCRLVTPPGGVVLDPFAGSGSTLLAAHEEGFGSIGIELSAEYCEIARARIMEATRQQKLF